MIKFNELFIKLYSKKKNLYILLIVGIFILISGNIFSLPRDKESDKIESSINVSASLNDEERLEKILSKVHKAGKTEVMITYDTGIEKVTIQNSKISKTNSTDIAEKGGGSEEDNITEEKQIVMNGSGNTQTPFIIKEITPRVRGVLILAEGADDAEVKYNLTNAVAAVLDVPYHKIQVLKKDD